MRFAMICLLAVMTASCATAQPYAQTSESMESSQAALPTIDHIVTSWGRTVSHSNLSTDGWLVREELNFNSGEVTQSTRRRMTQPAHSAAIAALEPLRLQTNRYVGCSNALTDGPSGVFTWDGEERLGIYYPCSSQHPELYEAESAFWNILNDDDSFDQIADD